MRIILATTCKGRLPHLRQTLPQNLRDLNDRPNSCILVLDYNSEDGLGDYIQKEHSADLDNGRLIYYRNPIAVGFKMGHAKNMAHRCAMLEGADILVTLDADNLTGPGFASYIAHQFTSIPGLSFLAPDFDALPPRGKRFNRHNPLRLGRGFAGRLAIRAQDFLKMGGYNEAFDTWRGEDIDFIARLDRLGLKKAAIPAIYLNAIAHGSEVRFKEYPHAVRYENDEIYEQTRVAHDTVVNYGRVGCGMVQRNFNPVSVILPPIPTRVFGIGFQRTGTSSLHEAFRLLGYDSEHWPSAEWAKTVWQEMNRWDRSVTLERSYAVCDNPIPILFKKLDAAYPGSKFVLTLRNEETWLDSVANLWTYERNPHRWTWDIDRFSHKMHAITYGTPEFDREVFLARYRQHNAEVMEHFRDRPGDLLVMHVNGSAGMEPLAKFLGKPTPEGAFPWKNPTQ